jgi:hypothetical protein
MVGAGRGRVERVGWLRSAHEFGNLILLVILLSWFVDEWRLEASGRVTVVKRTWLSRANRGERTAGSEQQRWRGATRKVRRCPKKCPKYYRGAEE